MAEKKKNKGGRPSKINNLDFRQVEILASYGLTDVQMSAAFGITEKTWNNWKSKNKKFFQSVKKGKDLADNQVKKSLYLRACGYSCPEDKVFNDGGKPLIVPTIKHYPPDTAAAFIWLKNRAGWRDKQEVETKDITPINYVMDYE